MILKFPANNFLRTFIITIIIFEYYKASFLVSYYLMGHRNLSKFSNCEKTNSCPFYVYWD